MYSLGELDLVLLNERGADVEAASLEESEDHASADDELVALAHEGVNDTNLGGNLQRKKSASVAHMSASCDV
jgi:hypothetical protein